MDKILKIYNIPEFDSTVDVLCISNSAPLVFRRGDYYIDNSLYQERLFMADNNSAYGGSWIPKQFETDKVYRNTDSDSRIEYYTWNGNNIEVYDTSFPSGDIKAEIYDFTYSSNRMGSAPKISATLMYHKCLDEYWSNRTCVVFNGVRYFIDKTPTSSFSNEDARYKHELEFVSERILLENVYFLNIVNLDYLEDYPVKDWTKFSFFGDIDEFVTRLNDSITYSRLGIGNIGFSIVVDNDPETSAAIANLEEKEKLISIENTFLKDALDMIYDNWGIPYYFDGYAIHIGFSNSYLMSSSGSSLPTFRYGFNEHLLSIQKDNSSDSQVNRCTGVGSSENIPYYYPNNAPNGLEPRYFSGGAEVVNAINVINPYRMGRCVPSDLTLYPNVFGTKLEYGTVSSRYNYYQNELLNPNYSYKNANRRIEAVVRDDVFMKYKFEIGETMLLNPIAEDNTTRPVYKDTNIIKKRMFVKLKDYENTATLSFFDELGNLIDTPNYPTRPYIIKALVQIHGISGGTFSETEWDSIRENSDFYYIPHSYNTSFANTYHYVSGALEQNDHWIERPEINTYEGLFPITRTLNEQVHTKYLIVTISMWVYGDYYSTNFPVVQDWFKIRNNLKIIYQYDRLGWVKNGELISLSNFGVGLKNNITASFGDYICFTNENVKPYLSYLMPYKYRLTEDMWYNAKNNTYVKESYPRQYYDFESEYVFTHAKEHIEDFPDIKPTIKGMSNFESYRIDQLLDITFDADDTNAINTETGEFYHPYFYAKLAKTSTDEGGFNLFDRAIDGGVMTINMTSGLCGGCSFEVMVESNDNGFRRNPVTLFTEDTTINGITYLRGTPKRDSNGDVLLNGNDRAQQDTERNEVWIALKKDNKTFLSGNDSVALPQKGLIEPTTQANAFTINTADTFVITNICLPEVFILYAEQRLEKAILDYMEENNPEKYNFTIKLSRIYYKKNFNELDRWLNESSKVLLNYNNITYGYYVSSYSYKMDNSSPLPEVEITLSDKVKIHRTSMQNYLYNIFGNYYFSSSNKGVSYNRTISENNGYSALIPKRNEVVNNDQRTYVFEGDVVVGGDISILSQMSYIVDRIQSLSENENYTSFMRNLEKSVALNSFRDGSFEYGFNRIIETNCTTYQSTTQPKFDSHSLEILVQGTKKEAITFEQNVFITQEYGVSTISFWTRVKTSVQTTGSVVVIFYDDSNNEIGYNNFENSVHFDEKEWKQHAFCVHSIPDASYYRIKIVLPFNEENSVYIDGMMVLNGNRTIGTQDSTFNVGDTCPITFIENKKDYELAINKALKSYDGGKL